MEGGIYRIIGVGKRKEDGRNTVFRFKSTCFSYTLQRRNVELEALREPCIDYLLSSLWPHASRLPPVQNKVISGFQALRQARHQWRGSSPRQQSLQTSRRADLLATVPPTLPSPGRSRAIQVTRMQCCLRLILHKTIIYYAHISPATVN
ncbi:hypothetical protein PoB_006894100 [Plakobranchus ocellatus]|uniref:Uncharacterized protein n=1 Tax=Plakobranchus ocellatus TaxID=259542 RepID=A0AAV4DF51_9GAST|nr:hypothetical protein PoB_006894100 [Plakobranchus ocellatus]